MADGPDVKSTLNLPQTTFAMKAKLTQKEPENPEALGGVGLYAKIQAARAGAPSFVLHDGPPYANGNIHLGTALNKILKDFIVKSRTMMGYARPTCRAGTATACPSRSTSTSSWARPRRGCPSSRSARPAGPTP